MATHDIAVVLANGLPVGQDDARHGDLRIAAKHRFGGIISQVSPHHGIATRDKDAPASRAIQACYLFDHAVKRERVNFKAPEGARGTHAKDTGLGECCDHGRGEMAMRFCFVGVLPNQGRKLMYCAQQSRPLSCFNVCHV
jgi:hypothetical protein